MPESQNVRIKVSNFGPIKEGEIELKPLTIFIGPNNSGKSYMATLVYALARQLSSDNAYFQLLLPIVPFEETYPELGSWIEAIDDAADQEAVELPKSVQQAFEKILEEYGLALEHQIVRSLQDYFGDADLNKLRHSNGTNSVTRIVIEDVSDAEPLLSLILSRRKQPSVQLRRPKPNLPSDQLVRLIRPLIRSDRQRTSARVRTIVNYVINSSWGEGLQALGALRRTASYLPSARSGILQTWPLFASLSIQAARTTGVERTNALLSGITADFLQMILGSTYRSTSETPEELRPSLALLEDSVFRGKISLSNNGLETPAIIYNAKSLQIPIQRASSMVAELAPLAILLRHNFAPNDLLIIDEPEAHLHPENQRLIARVLVRLIRAGVQVISPTHSSIILHQVSNLILASQLNPDERKRLSPELTDDDLISAKDVGVYLFDSQADGAYIREVHIDDEFGISEDEFVRVAEAIGDETYKLSVALAGAE